MPALPALKRSALTQPHHPNARRALLQPSQFNAGDVWPWHVIATVVQEAAEARCPGEWMRLPSGAGHDAQTLALVMPAAMLFVPSIEGKSHVFDEDTSDADLVLGCQVYVDAAVEMLQRAARAPPRL